VEYKDPDSDSGPSASLGWICKQDVVGNVGIASLHVSAHFRDEKQTKITQVALCCGVWLR
jgi:hypothetical protein